MDKVREYNIRNHQPQTVIVFRLYSGKTPVEICKKVLGGLGNDLPWDLLWSSRFHTRTDYSYAGHKVDSSECLVFYKVTGGDLPPRVELDNLKVFRKGVDGKRFNEILYKENEIFRYGLGKYIHTWDLKESKEKIKILNDLLKELP